MNRFYCRPSLCLFVDTIIMTMTIHRLYNTQRHVSVITFILVALCLQVKSMVIQSSRRDVLNFGVQTISSAAAVVFSPAVAWAVNQEEETQQAKPGLLAVDEVAALLKPIPTFTIVDKTGVPYFVVGEDAKVTSYFFTTYEEASRLLKVAKVSADKSIAESKKEGKLSKEEIGTNPWKDARISTMPLDFAITLQTKSNANRRGGTYFKVAPAETDIDDALVLTGQDQLPEGKVPLFYDEDFIIEMADGTTKTPLYFQKSELEDSYKKSGDKSRELKISVTELFAVVTELIKPGGTDMELKSVVFVTPKGSDQKRKECEKKGGKEPPFVFGQRNIIL